MTTTAKAPVHRTQVCIIGAGPSGLLLGALLHKEGIDNIVVERTSGEYVLGRVRAGILEQTTVDTLIHAGVGDGVLAHGIRHNHIELIIKGQRHSIELSGRTNGKVVTAYGQTEITRDLMEHRASTGRPTVYDAKDVTLQAIDSESPSVCYSEGGMRQTIACDFIAGCDGFHGVSRKSVPKDSITEFHKAYPFGWLGVLADVPPVSPHAIVYGNSDRGFSLCSMRSMTRSRYYVQCPLTDTVADWSDERFWDELKLRVDADTAARIITGPSIEKSMTPVRSFVAEPMRLGRLFLAGDAAHIVPPTGAKGLNLAASDVQFLYEAFSDFYLEKTKTGIDRYSSRALGRVWRSERFSWSLTTLMHRFPDSAGFDQKMQEAELDYLAHSEAAQTALAENYVGLQF